jgi:hypothetical protein
MQLMHYLNQFSDIADGLRELNSMSLLEKNNRKLAVTPDDQMEEAHTCSM